MSKIKLITAILQISFFGSACITAHAAINNNDTSSVIKTTTPTPIAGSISSNPGATNIVTGTGEAQAYIEKKLGIKNSHGIRIGGMLAGDANNLFAGGIPDANRWTFNGLFILDLLVDMEKLMGWEGGLIGGEFLQFNGQPTNEDAGTVQGYNSLPASRPLNRSELYQLWFRQQFFSKKLAIRIGKTAPTFEFGNVVRPVPLASDLPNIPAVSSLLFTPLFINPSQIGVLPGYYNSAYGITVNFAPIKQGYATLGMYDGSVAQGIQTGLTGPNFNGTYFHIGETGLAWLLGKYEKPGSFGIGLWRQSGLIQTSPTLSENGATGYYFYGSQRLWYKNPFIDDSGVSVFYQYGKNNSSALPMTQYVGAGLTAFGLIANRLHDSMGVGAALSWLNQTTFTRTTELMFQGYYQAKIIKGVYLEPALSYIPTPGSEANLNPAWAGTVRAIILF